MIRIIRDMIRETAVSIKDIFGAIRDIHWIILVPIRDMAVPIRDMIRDMAVPIRDIRDMIKDIREIHWVIGDD